MFAIIDKNSTVVGIETKKFEAPDELVFVEIPAGTDVQFGFAYANEGTFTNPNYASLEAAQNTQAYTLAKTCARQILSGFASSALGRGYTYASSEIDQRNLIAAAQATNGGLLACQDSTGGWSRQPHTKAQAQQVLDDFVAARDADRTTLGTLTAQINAAITVEAVQAVVWP